MKAFIGLSYLRGLLQLNHLHFQLLFSDDVGPPTFTACMSAKRFCFLHANLSFDDSNTRRERWAHDRFAAIREIFELFNEICSSTLNPNEYVALDETLYPCRTHISFKQYNSNKPAKYGLLFKSINAVGYAYTFRAAVYSGKPEGEPGPYYITGIFPLVTSLVEQLESHVSIKGRNITMDRLYSGLELFEWLLARNITAIGTIMLNRKGIPRSLTSLEGRENKSYQAMWESTKEKLSLHSYAVNTKSKGKKNVMLLSSLPPLLGTTKDDGNNKPAIMKLYDYTKGGTDIVDQRIGSYTTNSKSGKWTLTAFSYMLDTARVNSQTLCALNCEEIPTKTNSFMYGMKLAKSLIHPHIERRNTLHLSSSIKNKIIDVLKAGQPNREEEQAAVHSQKSTTRKRCASCINELAGDDRSENYRKLSRTQNQCQKCTAAICSKHWIQICDKCSPAQ
jgi:hypothetical protein